MCNKPRGHHRTSLRTVFDMQWFVVAFGTNNTMFIILKLQIIHLVDYPSA